MLRGIVIALGFLLLIAGAISAVLASDFSVSLWSTGVGLLLIIGTVFERVLYKQVLTKQPGPGWTSTGERFIDPETGLTVEVFFNASSGERRYVSKKSM